eukprot:gnl/TRDRNA2_/TRDRNA2_92023_c0_seq1.p1 gnl/TRDRNA2_/TRDRNA2_92023_c0~~gnl/TRDRNA2_/TRDRNA2_92023_c0_seq1.p1  ORF type:complete len:316 (+),score=71.25 gnl/TRDRNA2_/TRDRNA2_92023_c0_seq1:71-1018(+)
MAAKDGDEKKIVLSIEDGIKMQDQLIEGYLSKEFQEQIWRSFERAGKDEAALMEAKVMACQKVQIPVVEKFGFEASRKGVSASLKAFTNEMNAHPPIAERNALMQYLIDPTLQKRTSERDLPVPKGVPPSRKRHPDPQDWPAESGKMWLVVGGGKAGGILVRSGEDTKSPELSKRLASGAIVEELERNGDRLKYEKSGSADGPDMGWVSLSFKGSPLVIPIWQGEEGEAVKEESAAQDWWKVVHDRVVWREKASKDAKMLGSSKKGESLKGIVVEKEGVQWLKTRQKGGQAGEMCSVYVMVDGASVGLGKLLEKK